VGVAEGAAAVVFAGDSDREETRCREIALLEAPSIQAQMVVTFKISTRLGISAPRRVLFLFIVVSK
jgi:hypothetical protein